ncbi:MAG: CPBP family intramembrane metalloprotease [Candidatus Marsarchaeota archaeon]|nr:CPBP family intramembrane metalloprotease [Candidatus Marsarchaeota archaeon]
MQKKRDAARSVARAVYFIAILLAFELLFNALPVYLYYTSAISYDTFGFFSTAALSLAFSASSIAYLYLVEKSRKSIIERLGLSAKGLTPRNLSIGVFLFLIIFLLEVIVGLASSVSGVPINTNVSLVFAGAPLWFLVFASVVAPVNEEVLFRGVLVPRLGVFVSALFFAIPHLTYDSTFAIEFLAAFAFGLLAGHVFKKTGSLYPSVIAHILVNTLTLVSTFSLLI